MKMGLTGFQTKKQQGRLVLVLGIAAMALSASGAWAAFGFGSPAALNTNAATDTGSDSYPELATDGSGNWIAVWESTDSLSSTIGTDRDILVSRSSDNGATWSAPSALNSSASSDSAFDLSPHVTTDGLGNWLAVWSSGDTLGGTIGTDWDILFSMSTDNGATWSAQDALNSNATTDSGSDLVPEAAVDGAGNWIVVWHSDDTLGSTVGADNDILFSRSIDGGATWSAPVALNSNAATDSGTDLNPYIHTNGTGNFVVIWQSEDSLSGTVGTDRDIFISRSTNEGASWSAPAALNTNATTDSDHDYSPTFAADGAGNLVVAWNTSNTLGGTIGIDRDILVARSADYGVSWSSPAALNTNAATDSGLDIEQQVATDGAGNWVVVWDSDDSLGGTIGTDSDILVATSTDNGATWTAPAALNINATTDSGFDAFPFVAAGNSGRWLVAWYSGDTLSGTIGSDSDILFAASNDITLPVTLDVFGVE